MRTGDLFESAYRKPTFMQNFPSATSLRVRQVILGMWSVLTGFTLIVEKYRLSRMATACDQTAAVFPWDRYLP